MSMGVKSVIGIAVSLMVIALIFPLGLGLLGIAGDTVLIVANFTGASEPAVTLATAIDPAVLTLLTVLIPILAVIGVAVKFVSGGD